VVEPGFSSFPYGPIRGHGNILQSFTRASRFSGRSFTIHNPTYLPTYLPTQLTLCFTVCGRGGTAGEIAQVQPELDKPTLSPCHPVTLSAQGTPPHLCRYCICRTHYSTGPRFPTGELAFLGHTTHKTCRDNPLAIPLGDSISSLAFICNRDETVRRGNTGNWIELNLLSFQTP